MILVKKANHGFKFKPTLGMMIELDYDFQMKPPRDYEPAIIHVITEIICQSPGGWDSIICILEQKTLIRRAIYLSRLQEWFERNLLRIVHDPEAKDF